jgi:uncharacterized protein YceH (UPF0502 family)
MELVEPDVRTALFELSQMGLVRTIADARVSKFEHRVRDVLNLRRDEVAVLCLLLLRGPQTSAELRGRAERMYSFDDNAAVLATLERLSAQEEPLVVLLQRQPGAREARWSHLLSGAVSEAAIASAPQHDKPSEGVTERIAELEELVRSLEARVSALENPQDPG